MARGKAADQGRRAVIVGGLRTPFLKSGTSFRALSTLDLAATASMS